jgi:hypothetical protein
MSIRQHRIDSIEKIKARIREYLGKKITLVLSNQTSVLGELKSVEGEEIQLLVIVNGWSKTIKISFPQIKELYFDQVL